MAVPPDLPAGLRPGGRFAAWAPAAPAYVVADVDGTLLGAGTRATARVEAAAHAAVTRGLRLGVASGRPWAGIRDLAAQLRAAGPHVVHNGARVVVDGAPAWTDGLDEAATRALADACVAAGLYAELYDGDRVLVTERREAARPIWDEITGEPAGLATPEALAGLGVVKGTVVAFPGEDPDAVEALVRSVGLLAEGATSAAVPGAVFVNAAKPGTGKGPALRHAAGLLGLDLAATIAIGDGHNDRSMLEVAGTAVAMASAPAAVLEAAHLVAPDADADGVAVALDALA